MRLWRGGRLATLAGDSGWGLIDDGALLVEDGRLRWVGASAELPGEAAGAEVVELDGALVTPGLVDCHTHLVYGGSRAHEFEQRLLGASYADIAKAGGGIRSTVAATRAASEAELLASAGKRAAALLREGVTTLEVKSGYGLDAATEARMLRVARRLGDLGVDVRTTYLAAHALPPEFTDADAYIDAVCRWLPELHGQGLVDAVDAFCEHIAFSPAQVSRVFDAARQQGLPVKLHAEQLSDQGGSQLAAGYQALSCDHLEYLSPAGVAALARAGTVAVLLPGAFYALRETQLPPIAALREAGVPLALATDHNPGTSPTLSPLLMLNMACVLFRLTPEEALRGLTVNGALALGLADRGRLQAGQRADFCIWDCAHPRELAACFGHNPLKERVWQGNRQQEQQGQA
ncbi:MAG: imidazolonepropionase [Methylibium sp.]|jgi:imidazolonepropionase|nr:imidazolonepropionase [Methylibium sp.]MBY0367441.1 imidazolonepropionase [Burkholderiaceae bacterium]